MPTIQDTEIQRLCEENRHLRDLLSSKESTHQVLATARRQAAQQTQELANTREELEQQALLFDTVLSSIVDFAYTFDRQGRFTYVNQALLDLWQMELEDVRGKTFFELDYPQELAARLQEQIETVFQTGQTLKGETPYTGAQGKGATANIFLFPFSINTARWKQLPARHAKLRYGSRRRQNWKPSFRRWRSSESG